MNIEAGITKVRDGIVSAGGLQTGELAPQSTTMMPTNVDAWVIWKLTAINSELTHPHTEAALVEDAKYDLGKGITRELKAGLKRLVGLRKIVKSGDLYRLPNCKPYRAGGKAVRFELSDRAKAMSAQMRRSAKSAWQERPQDFWVRRGKKVVRGTRADVQNGLLPIALEGGD